MTYAIAVLALGFLVAFHELGHYVAARAVGMKVLRYSIGFFKPIASWTSKRTGITYQLGALPLGGFVQIKGMNPFEDGAFEDPDSYQVKSTWRRLLVIAAGPAANVGLAVVALAILFTVGSPVEVNEARVGAVTAGAPADAAGLLPDDRILSVDGAPVATWDALVAALRASPGKALSLEIERGGARRELAVTPEDKGGVGIIGIGPPTTTVRLPPAEALPAAVDKCSVWVTSTITALGKWITREDTSMSPVGPLGIVKMAASSLDLGPAHFVAFTAYLSVMLFLFNLFPFPALDGGRCLVLIGETIARRRLNRTVDAWINTAGFFLVLGLIAVITVKEAIFG